MFIFFQYSHDLALYSDDDHEDLGNGGEDYPDYEVIQLSPADVQRMTDMEGALYSPSQAKALQDQVWLDPALPEIRYPAQRDYEEDTEYDEGQDDSEDYNDQYDLQPLPYQTSAALHKKDIEQLQYLTEQANMQKVIHYELSLLSPRS